MLNDSNFKSWHENLSIVLVVMDLDHALMVDSSPPLTDESTPDDKRKMERWERSNRMCIMIMKKAIPKVFRGSMTEKATTIKGFLAQIEHKFFKNEKAEIGTLLTSLILMRYMGKGNIRECIMEVSSCF